jgi:hypothetical protein
MCAARVQHKACVLVETACLSFLRIANHTLDVSILAFSEAFEH